MLHFPFCIAPPVFWICDTIIAIIPAESTVKRLPAVLYVAMEEYLRDDVEALKAWGTWYENGVHSNFLMKTFCVCFSESKDKLSQWRGYAQDGKGIAIGFDRGVLEELNQISELIFIINILQIKMVVYKIFPVIFIN